MAKYKYSPDVHVEAALVGLDSLMRVVQMQQETINQLQQDVRQLEHYVGCEK